MSAPRRALRPERDLLPPLLEWLVHRRIARPGALLAQEVFLHGKRIDVVLLGRTGVLSTFELKTNHSTSVLAQARLNVLSADRSYVVSAALPSSLHLEVAERDGIGWIVIRPDRVIQVLRSRRLTPVPEARARLLRQVRNTGEAMTNVQ